MRGLIGGSSGLHSTLFDFPFTVFSVRFVFFKTQVAAVSASHCPIHAEDNREFRVEPCPGAEQVNWAALWLSYRQRNTRWVSKG